MKNWGWFNVGLLIGFALLGLNYVAPEPGLAFGLMLGCVVVSFVGRTIADVESK